MFFFSHPLSFSGQTVRAEGLIRVIFFTQMQSISAMKRFSVDVKKTKINMVVKNFKRTVFISGSEILTATCTRIYYLMFQT